MNTRHENTTMIDPFLAVLAPTSRSPYVNPEDDLYGFLIGSWDLDLVAHDDEGNVTQSTGEAHFARVLDGRAIQDVFINPRRSDAAPTPRSSPTGTARRFGILIPRSAHGACSG